MGRFSINRRNSVRTDDGEEQHASMSLSNEERQASIASVSASAASSMNRRSSRAPSFNIAQPSAYRQTSIGNPSAYPSSPLVLMTPPLLSKKNSVKDRSRKDDPQLFDGFDGVHIQDGLKEEEEASKEAATEGQFEVFADDASSYHRNDSFVRYEPEHINTQAVAALAQTHVHTVQSPYIHHHASITGHVVDDIDQEEEEEDDDEVYVQAGMDHSVVQVPEIELPRQPSLETPAADFTNDSQNLRDNRSLEAAMDEQPHHNGELGLNEDEIALQYELEPEEAGSKLAHRDLSSEEEGNTADDGDDDDDDDDNEFTDAQMELKGHETEDEDDDDEHDIKEITKDQFENQPTLYHPKPQRAVSHSNLEEEVANDAELRESSLQNDEPSAATISAVGGSPVVLSKSESADELSNIRKHQKSKSFSFAPPAVPRPRSALKPRPTSAIDISIDHDALTDIDLNEPIREMTVQEKRASRIAEKHNRRASVASMRSMMSNNRRSVLEPRPTSTIMSPPPEEQAVFYPAPIPVQLALPPLLSKRNKARNQGKVEQVHPLHFNPQRASSILPPPTWHTSDRASVMSMGQPYPLNSRQSVYSSFTMNEATGETPYDEFASSFSRSASPALSMDSGRATIESEMEDNDLDLLNLGDRKPLPPPSPKKKKKRSKKARSIFGTKKLANSDDEISDDGIDPDEMAEEQDAAMKNIDHLAFTDYNPAIVAAKTASMLAFGSGGFVPGPGAAPTSLIEELEMRKAGRKARAVQVAKESRIDNNLVEDDRRLSRHPLDMRASRSLMQLQQLANRDYDDQVAFQQLNRLTRANIHVEMPHNYTPSIHQDDNPNESLTARRQRLKAAKKMAEEQAVADQETLGQRRARLKQEKAERQRQSQLIAV